MLFRGRKLVFEAYHVSTAIGRENLPAMATENLSIPGMLHFSLTHTNINIFVSPFVICTPIDCFTGSRINSYSLGADR